MKAAGDRTNLSAVVILSISFFILMFSFMSAASIYSKLLKENNHGDLGNQSLSVVYLVFSLSCFMAPKIAKQFSPQKTMSIAASAYSIWIVTGFLATLPEVSEVFVIMASMFGSILIGIGASVIWVAQGKYLSECISACPENTGFYTSLFFTIVAGSNIFTYLYNSAFLTFFSYNSLFLSDTITTFISVVLFAFLLPNPIKLKENNN